MATGDMSFTGDVSKLIQIGTNHGSLFVINSSPVATRLNGLPGAVKIQDVQEEIDVFVTSKRFGNRVKLTVPAGIRAAALTETLVDLLKLPRNYRVEEIRLELSFKYTLLFGGARIGPFSAINDFGVKSGSELEILIDFGWKDPLSDEPEKTNWRSGGSGGGEVLYAVR